MLAELAGRPELLALSFHVDYWDRLGWKDPFSTHAATQRQQRYAELLGLATVYTPQIVVDGQWQAVGSNRAEVEHALTLARRGDARQVPVALAIDRGQARISLGPSSDGVAAAVWLIGFDRRHVTAVARGENAGRTLAHVDVVRSIEQVAPFTGPAIVDAAIPSQGDRVAAIVQARDGRVLGIAVRDSSAPP